MTETERTIIDVERNKVIARGQSVESLKPFYIGEIVSTGFEHLDPSGKKHNGKMKVLTIIGGELGFRAEVKCIYRHCKVKIEIEGVPKK